ncbi:MAG: DUF721 domain-containing protein [Spirochaetia bacterium]|nr:DUF721 domain-containing protein [Spirochaetia bacterium]
MDDLRVRKASDLLGSILSPDAAAKADQWSSLFGFWKRAAGDALAAHSKPVDLRNGIVFVETDHPGWIQLLQLEQNRILSLIKKSFPELGVSGIAFKLAKDGSLPGTVGLVRSPPAGRDAGGPDTGGPDAGAVDQVRMAAADTKTPTVKETLAAVVDEEFRGILSSLAKTLKEANKESNNEYQRTENVRDY